MCVTVSVQCRSNYREQKKILNNATSKVFIFPGTKCMFREIAWQGTTCPVGSHTCNFTIEISLDSVDGVDLIKGTTQNRMTAFFYLFLVVEILSFKVRVFSVCYTM